MTATDFETAVSQAIVSSNQLHDVVNGTALETVDTDSGEIPSVRKALADSMRFLAPIPWEDGIDETNLFQTRSFESGTYWAPSATTVNPVPMGSTPVGDSNWFLAPVSLTDEHIIATTAPVFSNANLLSNHNFLKPSPDAITHPSLSPTDYVAGTQIFSGVYVESDVIGLTYINGRVKWTNDTGSIYLSVPNTNGLEYITEFTASVADFDGKPRTRGVSFALVGDEYRVTVGIDALSDGVDDTLLGSVKFEQGKVATGHEFKSLFDIYGHPNMGIYDPRSLGANPSAGVDNYAILQNAIDEWGQIELRDNTYEISSPIVMKTAYKIEGERFKARLVKTTNTAHTSPNSGATSDCAIFLDDSPYNFYSTISGIDIQSSTPNRMDCSIYVGNSAHLNLEYIRCDANADYGLRATSCWMSSINHVRVGQSFKWGFYFPLTGLGTSLHLSNCYTEACGGGYLFSNCTYSTMTSCGSDYTNTGGKPGNPYSRAGGDYQSEGYIFRFSASDFTLNSCGSENSTANYLYCEGSFLTFNSCYTTQLENHTSGVLNTIGLRGTAASSVIMNSSRISCENKVDSELRGLFIENPSVQALSCDLLPSFQGYRDGNAYSSLSDTTVTTKNSVLIDPSFKTRVPQDQSQFQVRYDSSYTDSEMEYVDINNNGTFALRFSGDSSSAPDGAQINTKWRIYINRPVNKSERAFLSIKGSYSTGGYGNPRVKLMEADLSTDLGDEITSYPVAGIADGDYLPIDLSLATKDVIFLEITIFYKGSYINADKIDFFTCSTSGRLDS